MTREEYNILRDHGDRLGRLEENLGDLRESVAALPGVISDDVALKVTDAVAACRAESEERRTKVAMLWSERERRLGVTRFWIIAGKVLTAVCALAGAAYGLISLLT